MFCQGWGQGELSVAPSQPCGHSCPRPPSASEGAQRHLTAPVGALPEHGAGLCGRPGHVLCRRRLPALLMLYQSGTARQLPAEMNN